MSREKANIKQLLLRGPCNTSCDSRPPLFVFFFSAEMPEDVQERAGRLLSVRRAKPAPSAAAAPSTAGSAAPFTHGACRVGPRLGAAPFRAPAVRLSVFGIVSRAAQLHQLRAAKVSRGRGSAERESAQGCAHLLPLLVIHLLQLAGGELRAELASLALLSEHLEVAGPLLEEDLRLCRRGAHVVSELLLDVGVAERPVLHRKPGSRIKTEPDGEALPKRGRRSKDRGERTVGGRNRLCATRMER